MAQVFGERSKYLIWLDYASRAGAILTYFILVYVVYAYFKINFTKSASIISIAVATMMYLPLGLWIKNILDDYIQSSLNFKIGRNAEYEICDELAENLPDDYLVFQDIKIDGKFGNIDLVAIGKTGIFTLEVKSHGGRISFDGNNLLRNSFKFREKNILSQAMNGAVSLNEYLKEKTGKYFFITPALVFSNKWASMKFGFNQIKKVNVVQKRFLTQLILRGENKISEEDIVFLRNELNKLTYPERIKNA